MCVCAGVQVCVLCVRLQVGGWVICGVHSGGGRSGQVQSSTLDMQKLSPPPRPPPPHVHCRQHEENITAADEVAHQSGWLKTGTGTGRTEAAVKCELKFLHSRVLNGPQVQPRTLRPKLCLSCVSQPEQVYVTTPWEVVVSLTGEGFSVLSQAGPTRKFSTVQHAAQHRARHDTNCRTVGLGMTLTAAQHRARHDTTCCTAQG